MRKRKSGLTDEDIVAAYRELKSTNKVSEALGIGNTTIHRVLIKAGVERTGRQDYYNATTRFSPKQGVELRRLYEEGALTGDLVKEFGGTYYSVKKAIRKAGGTLRPNPVSTITKDEIETMKLLQAQGVSQMKIAIKLDRSQSAVGRSMQENGIIPRTRRGTGRFLTGEGYVKIYIDHDDPMASMRTSNFYVLEHRLVMARKLGRCLTRTETVHHINGDRADNRPENLQLVQGRHGKGVVMCCRNCGSRDVHPVEMDTES